MPSGIIKSFAKKSGKPKKEVDAMWQKIKASLISQGHKESDSNFYALVVGSLKKSLKIQEEEYLFKDKFKKFL